MYFWPFKIPQVERSTTYRSKVNYLNVIFSMGLVLFMLGLFGYLMLYGRKLVVAFREGINLIVELKPDADQPGIDRLVNTLQRSRFVKPQSVRFISKEEAARTMAQEFGEDFNKLGLPNPFYHVVTFNVYAAYLQPDSLAEIRASLRQIPAVNDVFYHHSLADTVAANLKKVAWGALAIAVFFIFAAATLIHNTVRLALFANRFLIKNMELVGATWGFISRPYLQRAAWHGLISSALACLALWTMHVGLSAWLPLWRSMHSPEALGLLCAGLAVLGVGIGVVSTYLVVRKYLRLRVDELF